MTTSKLSKSLNKLALMSAASLVLAAPLSFAEEGGDEGADRPPGTIAGEERAGGADRPPGTMEEAPDGETEYRATDDESSDSSDSSDIENDQYENDYDATGGAASDPQRDDMSYDSQSGQQDSVGMENQQSQEGIQDTGMVSIGAGERVTADDLVDRSVVNQAGEEIGSVEDVVRSQTGEETALVVSSGGMLGFGGSEALIPVDEVELGENDQVVWQSNASSDEFEQQPEYNQDNYISIR